MIQFVIYQLVTGYEVIAEVVQTDDGVILRNPRIIDIEYSNGNINLDMLPYTIFASTIKQFSDQHVLSAVVAPPEAIEFYKNIVANESQYRKATKEDETSIAMTEREGRLLH